MRRDILFLRHNMLFQRRFKEAGEWLEQRGFLRRVMLGRADLLFIPSARQCHEAVVTELRRDPLFLLRHRSEGVV